MCSKTIVWSVQITKMQCADAMCFLNILRLKRQQEFLTVKAVLSQHRGLMTIPPRACFLVFALVSLVYKGTAAMNEFALFKI